MAYANIDQRRIYVKQRLESGISEKEIKREAQALFGCSYAAIHADMIFLRNYTPYKTYHLSSVIRQRIYARDGNCCQYCGNDNSETQFIIEHILPTALGGKAVNYNLVVACNGCNMAKGRSIWVPRNFLEITAGADEFRAYIMKNAKRT